jgi:hypothetical protein
MKNVLLLFGILSFYAARAQSLPFDFEAGGTASLFTDFNGGYSGVVGNPMVSSINSSDSVARIIRSGGDIWAGSKIILASNLDFSVMTKIVMKVYTTAPVGTVAKLKLEGGGPYVEVDAFTTVSGSWETLEWIFAGVPNNLNELVFMFDFGNIGDSTNTSTFYFDDVEQVMGPPAPNATSLPIDFETGIVDSDFLNYSGATASVIANPQMGGMNTSTMVGQIVRNGGDIWAGSSIILDSILDLSSMWHISMKIYTDAPVGTRVKLELQGPTSASNLDVLTTVSGAWETISWNFDGQANDFNRLSFMFDFGNVGDGSASSTFLFDDIQQFVGPPLPTPVPTSLPIDFESSVMTSDFINQFGAFGTVVSNPQMTGINTSSTVGHIVKSGGQPWARTKLILTNNIDFSTNSSISMKVYTDAPVGTMLKFKVESTNSGAANERDAFTTVSGDWATYTWDFAGDPPVYNVITFMFGYGTIGDASPNSTFLIDDIEQTQGPDPLPTTSLPIDFESEVSTSYFLDFDGAGSQVIANPQMNGINMSDSVAEMTRNGGEVYAGSILFLDNNLDFSTLGFISMKIFTLAPVGTTLKLKLEGNGGLETEVDMPTTVSGAWETIRWDFTGQPSDFHNLVFMFDFGNVGDSSAASTFLFDDIEQTDANGSVGLDLLSNSSDIKVYPNPSSDYFTFTSDKDMKTVSLFDIHGKEISVEYPGSKEWSMNVAHLTRGIYIAQISTEAGMRSMKLVIQ